MMPAGWNCGRQVKHTSMAAVGVWSSRFSSSGVVGSAGQVFDDQEHRLSFGQLQEDGGKRFERFVAAAAARG